MQNQEWIINNIEGAQSLADWFGYWPSFHDAEILSLHLNRDSASVLQIHGWKMTKELDASNHFILDKHFVANFKIYDIVELELYDFSCQNVIYGLLFEADDNGIKLTLEPCYGLNGWLVAGRIELSFTPGKPDQTSANEQAKENPH